MQQPVQAEAQDEAQLIEAPDWRNLPSVRHSEEA
jgi:hypothetical protein